MKESPFVEQIMVVGAEQKFVGALVIPSFRDLREWMLKNGLNFSSNEEAIREQKVHELYRKEIDGLNNNFNHVEQIKRFELLPHEWTIETGELTPTLKLKRKVIMEKYRDAVDRIYGS